MYGKLEIDFVLKYFFLLKNQETKALTIRMFNFLTITLSLFKILFKHLSIIKLIRPIIIRNSSIKSLQIHTLKMRYSLIFVI
jgi:hypothetical protein